MLSLRFRSSARLLLTAVSLLLAALFIPHVGQAELCTTDPCLDVHEAETRTALERPIRHHQLSEHFEIFYNPYHEERSEGIQEFLAPAVLDFAECAWALFFDPRLAGAHTFDAFADLPFVTTPVVDRFPLWVSANKCNRNNSSCDDTLKSSSNFKCSRACLGSANGANGTPRVYFSPLGAAFGCPSYECCDGGRVAEKLGDGIGNDDGYCQTGHICADDPFCITDEDCAVDPDEDTNNNGICDGDETCLLVDCTDPANYRVNCCGSTYDDLPKPAGFDDVPLHEFSHAVFKGHNRFFNSGALQFLNEGLPSGIMTVPLVSLSYSCALYSVINPGKCIAYRPVTAGDVNLRDYVDLRNRSLREPSYTGGGPSFWYFLSQAYSGIPDDEEYDDALVDDIVADGRAVCRNFINRIACSPGEIGCQQLKMRRIPGRDVIAAIQSELKSCHPLGDDTPVCMATTERTALEVHCAGEPGYPNGCVPGRITDWETLWDPDGVHHVGDTLMPKLMELVDRALMNGGFMTNDESGVPYQAFREFLIWNYLNGPLATRAHRDGQKGYLLKSFGANYHRFQIPDGGLRLFLKKQNDMPLWAHAVYNTAGVEPVLLEAWDTSPSKEIFIPGGTIRAVLVVTALAKTFGEFISMPYHDSGGHYMLLTPDVFDDDDTGTPNDPALLPPPGGWPAQRNDNLFTATPLEPQADPGSGRADLSVQHLNMDSGNDTDFFRVKVPPPAPNTVCSCSCLQGGEGMKLVISTSSEELGGDGLPIEVFYESSGGAQSDEIIVPPAGGEFLAVPLDNLGWRIALEGQTEVEICCPHDQAISGDPLLSSLGDLIFSVNPSGDPLGYDLEVRYEPIACDVAGVVTEIGPVVEIFDPKVPRPHDRVYPSERETIIECLDTPLACSDDPEVLGFDWQGGDFSLLASYRTAAADEAFRMTVLDAGGSLLAQSTPLLRERSLNPDFDDIGFSPAPASCTEPRNRRQPEEPGVQPTGTHLLTVPALEPGRYYVTVDGTFATRYRYQIGDGDGDGVADGDDVCPAAFDPEQLDHDYDGLGDACDPCAEDAGNDADRDGYCAGSSDCNDNDPAIHSAAGEICDGIDNNCNGSVDEDLLVAFKRPLRTGSTIEARGGDRTLPVSLELKSCGGEQVLDVPARLSLFQVMDDGRQIPAPIGGDSDSNTEVLIVGKPRGESMYLLRTRHLEPGTYRLLARIGPNSSGWADFVLSRKGSSQD